MSELSPYQPQQQYSHKEQQTVIQVTLDSKESTESIPSDTQEYPLQDVPLPSYLTIPGRELMQVDKRHKIPADELISTIRQLPHLTKEFELMSPNMQSSTLFHLLKRSNTNTLKLVNSMIMPTLKRDFLVSLPHELKLQVTSYLDIKSLCICSRVSKKWRSLIEEDKNTWLRLLKLDGFDLLPSNTTTTFKEYYKRQYTLKRNWRKGKFKRTEFEGHKDFIVTCLQFDEEKIVTGATDSMINIYNTNDPSGPMDQLQGHVGGVWALQYINNTLVSGSVDRTVRVWNIKKRKCTHIFKGHTSTVRCLQIVEPVMVNGKLEPSQPLIVTGSRDSSIRVWTLPNVENIKDDEEPFIGEGTNPWFKFLLVGHNDSVRSIAAHGNTLVSGSYDNTVAVWNLETGRMVHRMEGHTSNVYAVVIDPIRQQCMSGSMDSTVYVWDLITGDCLHKLDGHSILVGLLGLTNNHLVSAAADRTLRVWNPNTGVCEHVLSGRSGHEGAITCFKHDDEKVISGSEGGLKMWDIKTGKHLYDLVTDVKVVWWVTFNKRRCIVAVKDHDGTSFQMLDFGAQSEL